VVTSFKRIVCNSGRSGLFIEPGRQHRSPFLFLKRSGAESVPTPFQKQKRQSFSGTFTYKQATPNGVTRRCVSRRKRWTAVRANTALVRALVFVLLSLGLITTPEKAFSQITIQPPVQDPMMSLMLSQPRIDVESPVQPTANFEPGMARPGERVTYRVVINALEASIEWPQQIPKTGELQLQAGAHGQLLAMNGALLMPTTTFDYHVRPSKPGRYTIPSFTIQVYGKAVTIPETQLEVRTDLPPSLPPAPELILELQTNNIYAGEAIRARVYCPPQSGAMLQGLSQVQLVGEGFIVDTATARPRVEPLPGRAGMAVVHEVMLTPIASGRLSMFAQGYLVGNQMGGGMVIVGGGVIPGNPRLYTLVDSDPLLFSVLPLPREGQLPGFTGAVGKYSVDTPQLATNFVRVGDPVKLSVRVRGTGNLVRLVSPPVPRIHDWQIFPASAESTHPQIIQAQGFTTLSFTLVPLNEKNQTTPPIPFSYFDPSLGAYQDCTIPSVPLTVGPGAMPVDTAVMDQAQNLPDPEEKAPVLSGLANLPGLTASSLVPLQRQAWFPLIQLTPAVALLGLWTWERRRRYYEAHPDALLRHRARRALRRERRQMSQAARAQDDWRFANSAVSALRVACSPYYPAEPRALVGADILAVLPQQDRVSSSGELVRHLFSTTDAKRYGSADTNGFSLLQRRGEVETLLDSLEARL